MTYGRANGSVSSAKWQLRSRASRLGACAIVLAGAGTASAVALAAAGSASAAAMPSVTLDYVAPASDLQLPLVAEQLGFFKKYGVNVQVALLPQSQAIPALVSGQIQMAAFQAPAPEVQAANGTPLKWLMQWENHSDSSLIARGATSVSQLAGKSIGITSAGSTSQVLTQMTLKQAGNISANLQPLGSVTAMASAFQSGSISAAVVSPPQDKVLVKQVPGAKILVNYKTQAAWPGAGIAALSSWTAKNKATTVKVLEGMIAAINYIKLHPATAAKIIAKSDDLSVADATIGLKSTLGLVGQLKTLTPSAAAAKTVLGAIKGEYSGAASMTPGDTFDGSYYALAAKKVPYKVG
jgi:ABC-type nitrate/sulfonate/bicarbonate transport system substrate-binding protein